MPSLETVSDLTKLANLDSSEILQQLKTNFENDKIYTYIADNLIAVNPYRDIHDLYSKEKLQQYQNGRRDPPHIYWTAEQSYKRLHHEQGNQCVIVTGDSGAGKTESTKRIIEYLVNRSTCAVQNLEEKLKQVNPLIELFGNASTILNNNSSRFGKLIQLSYDNERMLIGGDLRTFVLEKSRVVHHRANEKNFHIFYALFAGVLDQDLREMYSLEKPYEYRIMLGEQKPHLHRGIFQSSEEKQHYVQCYLHGLKILGEIGFNESDINNIRCILAACLHFGNIQFEPIDDETDGVAIQNEDCLYIALKLLGLKEDDFEDVTKELISCPIVLRGEPIRKPLNHLQACDVRDSVVKALYAGLFKAILDQINKSITGGRAAERRTRCRELSIAILDISGFESLAENSLEQLFINITNEQIHQYNQQQIFEAENKEYRTEGLDMDPNTFKDNTPVLSLIFDSPGILSILDDQSKVRNSDGHSLVSMYDANLTEKADVYQKCRQKWSFCIFHYAGQVTYHAKHFISKNTGLVPELLKEIFFEKCENPFVPAYFDQQEAFSSQRNLLRDTMSRKKARELSNALSFQRVIKGTKILAEIKRMLSRDKDQTWKIDKHNKEHNITKIIQSNKSKYATRTPQKNWEHGPGARVGYQRGTRVTENKSKREINTAALQYKKSLTSLIDVLNGSKPLFVRCIKSNDNQQSRSFDEKVVFDQLQSAGTEDVARIRRDGFQIRLAFMTFFEMCKVFRECAVVAESSSSTEFITSIMCYCKISNALYRVGSTKVFMKRDAYEKLNKCRIELIQKQEELRKKKEKEARRKREEENRRRQEEEAIGRQEDRIDNVNVGGQFNDTISETDDVGIHAASSSPHNTTPFTDDVSVDTLPPTYHDVENQNRRMEQKRWAWDAFRNTERDYEGCVELENYFLKFSRAFMYCGLFIGILTKGVATFLIPLLFVANLKTQEVQHKKSIAVTELIICYLVPNALTFIQSFFKICLGRVKTLEWKHTFPVLILESIEVCSTAYLLFKVFPHLSTTSCITLVMMMFSIPSLLNIYKQISLAKKGRKFALRFVLVALSLIAFLVQCGAIISLAVKPDIILSESLDKDKNPDKVLTVLSLIGVSLGYCTNFLYGNLKVFGLKLNVKDWRIAVDKARPKLNIKMCIIKVGLFLLMAHLLVPNTTWTLSTTVSHKEKSSGITGLMKDHGLMCLYIYGAIFTAYEGTLACKLLMQRAAFFIPLILVPLVSFGTVIGYCHQYPNTTDFYGGKMVCPDVKLESVSMWIGFSLGLMISIFILVLHVVFPKSHRMEREQRLFVLPSRDSFFSSIGLLMKRKDDIVEKKLLKHAKFKSENAKRDETIHEDNEKQRKPNCKARPYVYICGTMWHETRQEMLQLLKSLFRLDFHRSTYRMAEKGFKVNVDYFEQEIHIIFDDAFETDKKSRQRLPNDWVKQLVECIDEAASSIAKGRLQNWDNKPVKTSTPYGGRLKWTMPGGTEMTFHLKDKDKIRHRKRWSQIMYMYYLLGYKMMGAILEDALLDRDTNKRYHYRRVTSILNHIPKDKVKKAHNSFILALDGDVDFKPEAVQKLIDKMTKNDKVGAVCGRIHPIGSGPVVWYQQFEYAIGHWLQKATEHVFGCVLCCPGAFSLFRATAIMDDNVMKTYTSPPEEARHFIQYEQGEDRWLCTLMLQQGWKIDYAASADAYTFAPESFKEFFVQRRRWAPSTLANIIDLLASWRVTTKINDNISTLFVFYQFVLLASSLLGIGTVTLMITGSFNAVLKISMVEAYVIALVPVIVYALICLKCNNDKQIAAAALLTTIYSLVMVIVTVGLFVSLATEEPYSPNVIFFVEILFIFLCAGVAHPKEIMCLVHGLLYYLMVPSTFIFLTVYYMCNIHVVSWGTREKKKEDDEDAPTENKDSQTAKKEPVLIRCLQKIGVMTLIKELTRIVKSLLGADTNTTENEEQIMGNLPPIGATPVPRSSSATVKRHAKVRQDPDAWQAMEYLGSKQPELITKDETNFWLDILDKYLHPIIEDKEKKKQIEEELKSLRNNVAFGFLMINFLFATAVFQLQNNEDQLKRMYILNEYEPLSVAFLLVFAIIIFVQFIGMLMHRWGTFLHLISSVRLFAFSKAKEEEWAKRAIKETENMQSANPEADDEVASISCMSFDSRVHDGNAQIDPDYQDDDFLEDHNGLENKCNEYEANFRRRFLTIRKNLLSGNKTNNNATNQLDKREHNRRDLYMRTIGRHGGARINHGHVV